MAGRLRLRTRLLLLPLLAATAHALWTRERPGPRPRYCQCLFQGNRHTANKQVCFPDQTQEGQSNCRSEMVPYLPDYYQHYMNEPQRLFSVHTSYSNVTNAIRVCKEENSRLAAPENNDMFRFVAKLLADRSIEHGIINFTDEKHEGRWTYFDGTPAPQLPWRAKQPDNWMGDENCMELAPTGQVNDIACTMNFPFVCERLLRKKIPKGYRFHNATNMFYKLYMEEKPFHLAKQTCELDGGKLAVPEDFDQFVCIIHHMEFNMEAYVDFTDEAEEGNFVTSEGRSMDEMEFQLWGRGDPDNGAPYDAPENCVVLVSEGFYMDVPCGHTKPFMCQLVPY